MNEMSQGVMSNRASADAQAVSRPLWWYGILPVVALIGLYQDIVYRLAVQWYQDPDYSHGFLVPVISGYLLWERRRRLRRIGQAPSFVLGTLILILGLLMVLIGSLGAELYVQRLSLIVVMSGLVLLVIGKEFFREILFPIAFLIFMVPLPAIVLNAIAFPLQLFAAKTATFCLFNLGIPVLREGNVILLSSTTLEVAEACSGIRSLQALLALGTIYAYFAQSLYWKRLTLMVLSVPIAIAANVFRVTGTGMLAHYWGSGMAEGFYHTFSGWLIFVVALLLLIVFDKAISRLDVASPRRA